MVIEGFPRRTGDCARARRAGALLSTTPDEAVQLQGTLVVNIYTHLADVGTHGDIDLNKPAGNPYQEIHYGDTWYTSAGGAIS